jgi:hypothetical protein
MLLSRTIRVIKPLAYFSSIPDNILASFSGVTFTFITFKSISHFCELLQFNEPITFFCGYTGTSIIIIYLSKYFNT